MSNGTQATDVTSPLFNRQAAIAAAAARGHRAQLKREIHRDVALYLPADEAERLADSIASEATGIQAPDPAVKAVSRRLASTATPARKRRLGALQAAARGTQDRRSRPTNFRRLTNAITGPRQPAARGTTPAPSAATQPAAAGPARPRSSRPHAASRSRTSAGDDGPSGGDSPSGPPFYAFALLTADERGAHAEAVVA